ncbi:DUF3144 domain-containing protein [Psychrobacter sp.]|uniref:DUF3144 domain-containing protein n=1 Tax=Psychrobacter sp. TaxID=56811 RepID=UPI00264A158D|nr:DUF3144 domain-containing protein [Psychrobacter sp.]MDN6276019.1 DUF3144 domain-containing protein [Psychrobacter sp.]MDN6308465.1 DUF3144 domain-containing protein [Psychrobacter sp.]
MSQENNQDKNNDPNVDITPEMQAFYQRADAIIGIANSQLGPEAHSGQVGASLLYAAARYSASVASIGFVKGEDFAKEKDDIVEFYVKQYRQMLSDNLTDYAQNFDKYVQLNQDDKPAQ